MKKLIIAFLFVFGVSSLTLQAQTNFEKDMTNLHIHSINACGLIKAKEHNQNQILKVLSGLKAEYASAQTKYAKNPPSAYAKDAAFGMYFVEFQDVIDALSARVAKNDYKRATLNCARICMTFNKMHMINGQLDLTDMMFSWNMQLMFTTNMLKVENYKGANMHLKMVEMLYQKVNALRNKKNSAAFNQDFVAIDALYHTWLDNVNTKTYPEAFKAFEEFAATFPKVFKKSL
ncbi:MAG: hypothetical protein J7J72_02050 [Bacteroidales bacterium]|nr:hypothetical protein [Bacteroidales bacterium]